MLGLFRKLFAETGDTQLAEIIKDGAFLVDVRTPGEFSSGSVKGAVNIPLDKLPGQLAEFKEKKHIVVFCLSGGRSGRAKQFLEQNGFPNVINGGSWRQVSRAVNQAT